MTDDGRPRRYLLRWELGGEFHADTLNDAREAARRRRAYRPDSEIVVHDLWDAGRRIGPDEQERH